MRKLLVVFVMLGILLGVGVPVVESGTVYCCAWRDGVCVMWCTSVD